MASAAVLDSKADAAKIATRCATYPEGGMALAFGLVAHRMDSGMGVEGSAVVGPGTGHSRSMVGSTRIAGRSAGTSALGQLLDSAL